LGAICRSLPGLSGPDLKGKEFLVEDSTTTEGAPERLPGVPENPVVHWAGIPNAEKAVNGMDYGIVAIVAIVVFGAVFGAKKIPEMARSVGRAQGEFKKGLKEGAVPDEDEAKGEPAKPTESSSEPTSES
jgi:sec-independent protein translocase protein TatA